jgi:hypothetical protein
LLRSARAMKTNGKLVKVPPKKGHTTCFAHRVL